MTAAAGRPYRSQKFSSRQIQQFAKGTAPEGSNELTVKPDIPALTQSLPTFHNGMIPTCDDPPRRSLKLPGSEGGIAVWPVDPTPFHKQ